MDLLAKIYQYEVKIPEIAKLVSRFFTDRQLHDEENVEEVIQDMNCNGNLIETQDFGQIDKDKKEQRT